MPNTATRVKVSKSKRTLRLLVGAQASLPAIVRITVDRKSALYAVTETPSEIGGRGFLVREISTAEGATTEAYQCLASGVERSCSCRDFARYGRCKHHDALAFLIESGAI